MLERYAIRSLIVGTLFALSFLLIGGAIFFWKTPSLSFDYRHYTPPLEPFYCLFLSWPHSLLQAGVILLILTPLIRIFFSLVAYVKEKRYPYALLSLSLFLLLLLNFVLGCFFL